MVTPSAMRVVHAPFTHQPPSPLWDVAEVGAGQVTHDADGLHLINRPTTDGYSNAQITDYGFKHTDHRPAYDFGWMPAAGSAVHMTVRAGWRTSHGGLPVGTGGFGFWNHPFSPDARRMPRLPAAIWFFYGSPPGNMALAHGIAGSGWKAATLDARGAGVWLAAPLTPLLIPLMRWQRAYDAVYPRLQRLMRIGEAALDPASMLEMHAYAITWRRGEAIFRVDDREVLRTPFAPSGGRLGFCAWQDTQYAIVTPQGRFGFGIVPVTNTQTLLIEEITITEGTP